MRPMDTRPRYKPERENVKGWGLGSQPEDTILGALNRQRSHNRVAEHAGNLRAQPAKICT